MPKPPRISNRPPKPVLALTIGVVGHRPDSPSLGGETFDDAIIAKAVGGVLDALTACVDDVAATHRRWFAEAPPLVALVMSLAEGADRIAAVAAGERNIPVDVVLPFEASEYAEAFSGGPASVEEFMRLSVTSRATLVLPRVRGDTKEESDRASLEQAAFTVLAQSDILLAVWNRQSDGSRGGTARSVEEAARQGIPTVIIDLSGQLWLRAGEPLAEPKPFTATTLGTTIDGLLLPPGLASWHAVREAEKSTWIGKKERVLERVFGTIARRVPRDASEMEGFRAYCATPVSRRFQLPGWRTFRWLTRVHGRHRELLSEPVLPRLKLSSLRMPLRERRNEAALERFKAAERAADGIAIHYAHSFRSAFFLNFVLAGLAAVCVAFSIEGDVAWRPYLAAFELALICMLVALVTVANVRGWRRRWAETREVAERLRLARIFWMLGVWPHALAAAQPAWTGWYNRSILREQPIFSGNLEAVSAEARTLLLGVIASQIRYNHHAMGDARYQDRRLEWIGYFCLALTVAVALIHLVDVHPSDQWERILLGSAIGLPALATACFGVRLFGDFEDTERRCERLVADLSTLRDEILGGPDKPAIEALPGLRVRARHASDLLLSDVANWRVVVNSRSLAV